MHQNPSTIIDIAKRLNLSKSTVSRALRDHPDISAKTKEAVRRVAEELNYTPNAIASSFRYRQSKLIGLNVPQISYYFFPSVIQGVEEVVHSYGYNLLILQSNESYEREKENLKILLANNVEGILSSVSRQTTDYTHFQKLLGMNFPLVFFDRIVKDLNADCVLVDDITASYNTVTHLLDRGRSKIAICTGNLNLLISQNRLNGYKMALQRRGLPIFDEYVVSCESPDAAEAATLGLLELPEPPDAIFAISDLTMSGVMRAIFKKNLKVPDEIAVIGFCEEAFRTMYNPPLSVIHPMGFEIGKTSAELLFERIRFKPYGQFDARTVYLDGILEQGGST